MTNDELIEAAKTVLRPCVVNGRIFGDVGAAVLSVGGALFKGVSVDTPSWGLCAERSAMAAMATAGEYRVAQMVAVWRDQKTGGVFVLPPCGVCRQFLHDIDSGNLEAQIVLARDKRVALRELLPVHAWPAPL